MTMYDQVKLLYENQLWSNLCQFGSLTLGMTKNGELAAQSSFTTGSSAASAGAPSSPEASSSNSFVPGPSTSCAASSSSSSSSSGATASSSSSSSSCSSSPLLLQLSPKERVYLLSMVAEAYFVTQNFANAEVLFKEALQAKKHMGKTKLNSSHSEDPSCPARLIVTEAEVKFKLFKCHTAQGEHAQALNVLQSVPIKQKQAKHHMALGKLYERGGPGMKRAAISCYKEVVKACPMAMEAAQKLMQLGVKAKDIQELTLEVSGGMEWFNQWIQAYSQFTQKEYGKAIQGFQNLENIPSLRNEREILVSMGRAQYFNGEYDNAMASFQRAHRADPNGLSGMDCLAALYAREKQAKDLERLATKLMGVTEESEEPWIAMGYYCFLSKKHSRAVYFGHKACIINHRSVEALLLKGQVLLELKKYQEAMNHFHEAMGIAPNRYELHSGLVDCYLAQSRHREATSVAASACKSSSSTPRDLTLFASVLIKDPSQPPIAKAKALLEKALVADPNHLPAVYLLVEILEQEMHLDQAISLLKKHLVKQSTCLLHQMLADLLAKTHDEEGAMEHYTLALNLDPKSVSAHEGLQKIEQATDSNQTYDLEMEDMNNSDENELEESETEAVWSDGDLNLATSNSSSRYM